MSLRAKTLDLIVEWRAAKGLAECSQDTMWNKIQEELREYNEARTLEEQAAEIADVVICCIGYLQACGMTSIKQLYKTLRRPCVYSPPTKRGMAGAIRGIKWAGKVSPVEINCAIWWKININKSRNK